MAYGKNDYRRDMKCAGRGFWNAVKQNFVCSVHPRNPPVRRIMPASRMVNATLVGIAKGLWNTGRRLLNK